MHIHYFIFGLLLGYGAAIPIGPMNLEIIRRNLRFGTPYGIALGLGASTADVTYLILLSLGALTILTYPAVLNVVGVLGSLILAWFGYGALSLKTNSEVTLTEKQPTTALWRHTLSGYALTLFNPFTILFWSSVSAQIAIASKTTDYAAFYMGVGVLLSTLSWSLGLNSFLHFTRHRLSERVMRLLNIAGGLMLLGFAGMGLWHVLKALALNSGL